MSETPAPPPPPDEESQEVPSEPKQEVDNEETSIDEALAAEQGGEAGFARGEALEAPAANRIAARARTTVVVLLGGPGSGKTTLLAAIYERFGRGPLAGHWFLGSSTLHGFEKRCHRSLHGTGSSDEFGGHTASGAPPWLHLRTAHQERPEVVLELLLGDFSGEGYSRPIADGSIAATDLADLRRADHVCLTIDGAKLANRERREAERRFVLDLTRGLLRAPEALANIAAISVVITKFDLLDVADDGRVVVEELFAELRQLFTDGEAVGYIETAARSSSDRFQIGFGVGDLLSRWTDRPALHIAHAAPSPPAANEPFDRFEGTP